MNSTICALATTILLNSVSAFGQDLTGDWQTTVQPGTQPLRVIVKLKKGSDGGWSGALYSIDQGSDWGAGSPVSAVVLDGKNVSFAVDAVRGKFQGTISADGTSLDGTWTQRQPLPISLRRTTPETAWKDPATHSIQFVTVDKNVKLEVLDWGGSGPPLVFLAGLGNTAHVFDKFAPKFLASRHVYGITRRGFGDSSVPPDGYSADRLGDDILAVLDDLKLTKPVLVGHSLGGEELSSIASRHPDRVSGLIYLDAGYWYAFYDPTRGDLNLDVIELRHKLEKLEMGNGPPDSRPLIKELLETDLPRLQRDLQAKQKELDATPPTMLAMQAQAGTSMTVRAIVEGFQKYTQLSSVPILAVYAVPHDFGPMLANDASGRAAFEAQDEVTTGSQASAFEKGVPSARVVRLPHANHYVFRSNEEDVLREMNSFLAGIK
jgi:pimeloyl-ACP methyl ester carboxylesterase